MSKISHNLRAMADYGLFDLPIAKRQPRGWTAQQMVRGNGPTVLSGLVAATSYRKGYTPAPYTKPEPAPKAVPWWLALASSIGRLGRARQALHGER